MTRRLDADALLAHGRFLRALAHDLLSDEHLAEDVVQETWLRAMQSPPHERGSLRAWLATVTRNLARDRQRSDAARRRREQNVARSEITAPVARFEAQQRVAAMVTQLDAPHRDIIILRYFDGLTTAEIARRLDLARGAVRTRLHRALGVLRARLDESHDGNRRSWAMALAPFLKRPRRLAAIGSAGGFLVAKLKTLAVVATALAIWGVVHYADDAPPRDSSSRTVTRDNHVARTHQPDAVAPRSNTGVRRLLRGRVILPDGSPAAAARVDVRGQSPIRSWYAPQPKEHAPRETSLVCDDQGRFQWTAEHRNAVSLHATLGSLATTRSVNSGRDDRRVLELHLQASVAAAVLVLDPAGRPLAGAEVRVGRHLMTRDLGPVFVRHTNEAGRAIVDGIPPNPWGHGVIVRAPGMAEASYTSAALPNAEWTVRMVAGETYRGRVVDATQRSVPGARVRWICEHARFSGGEVLADDEGHFKIPAVPPHPIVLLIDGGTQGHTFVRLPQRPYPETIALDPVRARRGTVSLEDGTPVPGLRVIAVSPEQLHVRTSFTNGITVRGFFELMRAARTDAQGHFFLPGLSERATQFFVTNLAPYRLVDADTKSEFVRLTVAPIPQQRGRVVDNEGSGIADARVVQPGGLDAIHHTDASGWFSFRPRYNAQGNLTVTTWRISKAGFADEVVKTGDDAPVFTLQRAARVTGWLVDGDREPVTGARVSLSRRYTFSDHEGRVRVWVRPGQHALRVQCDGFESSALRFEATGKDLELAPTTLKRLAPASLRGVIQDATGQTLAGVTLEVHDKTPWRGDFKEPSDHNGRFEFPLLSEGILELRVDHPPYAPYRATIDLRGAIELEPVVLEFGLTIRGVVTDQAGAPVANARVLLAHDEKRGSALKEVRSDEQGRFRFESLRAGAYLVVAAAGERYTASAWTEKTVHAGSGNVVLSLPPATWIGGTLLSPDGTPLVDFHVYAQIEDAVGNQILGRGRTSTKTDADGRFRIDGIWGARCRLQFSQSEHGRPVTRVVTPRTHLATGREHILRAKPGGAISGTVVSVDGTPFANATVSIHGPNHTYGHSKTSATGQFRFLGLTEAAYRIHVRAKMEKKGSVYEPRWVASVEDVKPGVPPITLRLRKRSTK